MKKIYQCLLIFLLGHLPFQASHAKGFENEFIEDSIDYAISLLDGASGNTNEQKAFSILSECVERNDPRAMNALGLAYMQGLGVIQDADTAIEWLEKAGEHGYSRAYQNLGTMFKYARCGVTQDFEKAFTYFTKGTEVGGVSALYDVGYMLYKGLGCKQDYSKAADYFERGGGHDFPPCMYMLGLCYRNGYGREKDIDRARFWLDRAAQFDYRPAFEELTNHEAENDYYTLEVSADDTITVPRQYLQVKALHHTPEINGKYQGILAVYDWSGCHIIAEKILELDLTAKDSLITGMWKEDKDTVWIKAKFKDGILHFENTLQKRSERYSPDEPLLYEFTNATIETIGSALTGNVQMYSPRSMEPERPMYLSLQKVTTSTEVNSNAKKQSTSSQMPLPGQEEKLRAYPNPFTGSINVRFILEEESTVQLALYNSAGKNVYMSSSKSLSAGEQILSLTPRIPEGVYIMKVYTDNRTWQAIVVKKGDQQ